jgi:hypothetical protein
MENYKLSTLVKSQLPDFVRGEYPKFVTFLEKYYEWLEQTNRVNYAVEALVDSNDIDYSDSFYIEKLKQDLAPYFPQNIVNDKRLFLKLVTNFYKSSGTPQSVKFLFKALYNDNIDIYYPKEDILKTSDGKWILPLALRIDTNDNNIFNIAKTKITGLSSKSSAVVEKVIRSVDRQLGITYIEAYVSNVERLFQTGETLSATYYDENSETNVTVTGKLIGSLSEIKINPTNRGLFYNGFDADIGYNGDPVSIVGGLNANSANPIGAIAYVGDTTKGGISDIFVLDGGFGFRSSIDYPNSSIVDFKGGFENSPFGSEAKASIGLIDEDTVRLINVSNMAISTLDGLGSNTTLTGTGAISPSSNIVTGTGTLFTTELSVGDAIYVGSYLTEVNQINSTTQIRTNTVFSTTESGLTLKKAGRTISRIRSTTIENISTYSAFNVHPISFITIDGSGGGYRSRPTVETYSFYNEDLSDSLIMSSRRIIKNTNYIEDTSQDLTLSLETGDYVRLFIPNLYEEVKIITYVDTNRIYFSDNFQNDIPRSLSDIGVSVYKINRNDLYNIGSIGRIDVNNGGTGYANGDILIFTGGSGYGANGYVNVSAGVITSVTINNHSQDAYVIGGEGYKRDSLPAITVQSAAGAGANLTVSEIAGDGESYGLTTSRIGAVSSIRVISYGYDYVSAPYVSLRNADLNVTGVTAGQLFVSNTIIYQGTSNTNFSFKASVDSYDPDTGVLRIFDYVGTLNNSLLIKYDSSIALNAVSATVVSSTFYGDGNAKATAKFENGLIRYPGIYLNTDGQVSSDKRLQDGEKYHNFSYVIKSTKDYATFKKPLNEIVHPIGTKTFTFKTDENKEIITTTDETKYITINDLSDTYNIAASSNTITTTNVSANLITTVNVGDIILLSNVHRRLVGTVNVSTGSNIIISYQGTANFLNDFQEGDTLYLSTGNTVTVREVTNANVAIVSSILNVSSTQVNANVVLVEYAKANSVNANTIITTTTFKANGSNLFATIQKVR